MKSYLPRRKIYLLGAMGQAFFNLVYVLLYSATQHCYLGKILISLTTSDIQWLPFQMADQTATTCCQFQTFVG